MNRRGNSEDDEFETVVPVDQTDRRARLGPSLKARAVGFLSRREHARRELERKLARYAESPEALAAVLDALEKEGWLSTTRYAQSVVHRRAPGRGTALVLAELRQQGVPEAEMTVLREQLLHTESKRARGAWQKRFNGVVPADRADYARQARFLAARGFSHDIIHRILAGASGQDE